MKDDLTFLFLKLAFCGAIYSAIPHSVFKVVLSAIYLFRLSYAFILNLKCNNENGNDFHWANLTPLFFPTDHSRDMGQTKNLDFY